MRARLAADAAQAVAGLRAVVGGRPVGLARMAGGLRAGGVSFAGVVSGAAARFPDAVALVDRAGPVTARELEAAADDVARQVRAALGDRAAQGADAVGPRRARVVPPTLGVQVGDHRGFVAAVAGVLRAGADAVLVGPRTGSAALARVVSGQRLVLMVRDAPDETSGPGALVVERVVADGPAEGAADGARDGPADDPRPAGVGAGRYRLPRVVLLTAGTTGPPTVGPVAARRPTTDRLLPQLGLLAASGIRAGRPVLVLAPVFHGHGFAFLAAGLLVGAPVVLVGARTGAEICAAVATHGVGVVTGVPVHLQRFADHLATEHTTEHDSCCPHTPAPERVVSGSARLPPAVVSTLTEHLGDVVVDIFGSTQTGSLTVATPADLRAAPGTVGRPAAGVRLAVVDDDDRRCPPGTPGRVALVEGRPGRRRVIPSGDLGAIDRAGRLILTGRADDVVVCGGENVRPGEVAEFLAAQPGVRSAAVGPVADAEYGTRLIADVVLEPGGPLTAESAAEVLRAAVRTGLAPHAVPRSVRVVEDLRRSAVGKPLPPTVDDADYVPSTQPSGSASAAAAAGPQEPGA